MNKTKIKKVVGYARVSSDSQIDNTSIGEQKDRINLFSAAHRWEVDKFFTDEGKSGKDTDRAGYAEMIQYIQENEIDAIVVLKSDRIHRSLQNLLNLIKDVLEPLEIAFISVSEQFDTSTPQGMLFLQMIGSFAEFERSVINERTKSGRISSAKKNKYAGGSMPYGYEIESGGSIAIVEREAEIVKRIFKDRIAGDSLYKIAKTLSREGIETKRGGSGWTINHIKSILKNETYTGVSYYDGAKEKNQIKQKGVFPRIISKQAFNKAQKIGEAE